MKKILAALVLTLTVTAASCKADGCCVSGGGSYCQSYSFGFKFKWAAFAKCGCGAPAGWGDGGSMAGPWYSYWPLEAHFQTPAPTGFPYWPAPMDSNVLPQRPQAYGYGHQAPPAYNAPRPAAAATPAVYQPVGYFQQAPSYWYGN